MHLQELRLQNFRCFTDTTISFDERLTVLVGKNGSGKTAILDAAAIALNNFILHAHGIGTGHDSSLSKNDLSNKNQQFNLCSISTTLQNNNTNISIKIDNQGCLIEGDLAHLHISHLKEYFLYSYYTTIRMQAKENIYYDINNRNNSHNPADAYANCFQPGLSFGDTLAWIDTHDADEARRFRDGDEDYRDPELSAMREAVEKALPDFGGLRFRGTTNEILVTRKTDGQKLSFWQLSDGYRAMLALILDLARRMAIANGERYTAEGRSILTSPAIVLIDEIELHLHPGWQQTVLPSLREIFPNTQFIVSTHSPQVLSSIEPQHVRILGPDGCIPYDGVTYGAESSRLLEDIFGIELRSESKAKKMLDEYFQLINNGDYDSPRSQEYRAQLEKWMRGDPALDTADMLIRRAERQKARGMDRA